MAYVRYYPELRRMQKVANERIRQLERSAEGAPALRGIQATLEMMGKKGEGKTGRRFSETGKGTYHAVQHEMKILRKFLAGESTITRYKKRMKESYEAASRHYPLDKYGITQEKWYDIWDNAADKESRQFGSDIYVEAVERMEEINGKRKREDQLTIEDIVNMIDNSKTLSDVYENLGIDMDWEEADVEYFD